MKNQYFKHCHLFGFHEKSIEVFGSQNHILKIGCDELRKKNLTIVSDISG